MKDRKPPYVLGGIVIIALAACIFIGIGQTKNAIDPEKQEQEQQQQQQQQKLPNGGLGNSRKTPSPTDIASSFSPHQTVTPAQMKRPPGAPPLPPSILNQKQPNAKPRMSATDTYSIGAVR